MRKYLLLLLVLFVFSGCGTVRSEADLVSYAKNRYGRAKLLRTEENEKSRTCYFLDKELQIEYYVTSFLSDVTIDGSYFGSVENTSSNYGQIYFPYLAEKINESHHLSGPDTGYFTCETGSGLRDNCFVLVIDESAPDHVKKIRELAPLVKEYDSKKQNTQNIKIVNILGEDMGEYDCEDSRYLSPQEVSADYYMERMKDYTGRKPQYLYCESAAPDEVEGLERFTKVDILGGKDYEQEGVELYYFEMDGATYFITDCTVYEEGYPERSGMLFYNTYTGTPYK